MDLYLIKEMGIRGDNFIGAAKFVGLGGKMKFHSNGFFLSPRGQSLRVDKQT